MLPKQLEMHKVTALSALVQAVATVSIMASCFDSFAACSVPS